MTLSSGTKTLRLLKKYPNRRIYDTQASRFITLADVRQIVISREPFQVIHSKTGKDLTRNTLLQIISEMEEEGHESLLTNRILEELIRFYGDSMVQLMAPYLEQQILRYLSAQDQLRNKFTRALARPYPSPEQAIKKMVAQYLALAEKLRPGSGKSKKATD
jgi:polyhydroxyalkanoate synthesis repressor PhaR